MDLEQVNKTIKMLINNIDFYNMILEEEKISSSDSNDITLNNLEAKPLEEIRKNYGNLEFIYSLARRISKDLQNSKSKRLNITLGFKDLKTSLNMNESLEVISTFYQELGIPREIITECLNSEHLQITDISRAYQRGGIIYMPAYENSFEWLKTLTHEIAHKIRLSKTKGQADGFIAEIESKVTEIAFYQYLINREMPIIKEANGKIRPLNNIDVESQKILEMNNEFSNINRIFDEYAIVKILESNKRKSQAKRDYTFTKEGYEKLSLEEKEKLKSMLAKLESHYLPPNNMSNVTGIKKIWNSLILKAKEKEKFSLHNGEHLFNEVRFIIARLFITYATNHEEYLSKIGNFLLDENISSLDDVKHFFYIESLDNLVPEAIESYQKACDIMAKKDDNKDLSENASSKSATVSQENPNIKIKQSNNKSNVMPIEEPPQETLGIQAQPTIFDSLKKLRENAKEHFSLMPQNAVVQYKKMQEEAKNMNLEEQKEKTMSRVLVKKDDAASNKNNSSSGFISILLLTLGVGFISGVVSVLAYLFISR